MRILTINVIGIPRGSSSDLVNANVFQDYDAVVVDPENLDSLYGNIGYAMYDDRKERTLKPEAGHTIDSVNEHRREQVNGLLQRS